MVNRIVINTLILALGWSLFGWPDALVGKIAMLLVHILYGFIIGVLVERRRK